MGFVKINSNYTAFLPQEIAKNETISLKLSAAIRVLQNLSSHLAKNLCSIDDFKNRITNKRLFIREIAESLSFSIFNETIHKTCKGHDIRISNKRYHSKKRAEKLAQKYEENLKKINTQSRELKEFNTYLQKQGSHYDIRLTFIHFDNVPICNYPTTAEQNIQRTSVLNVLDQFESILNQHQINIESSYSTLLELMFRGTT